jgi:glycosyltransferase involved in cell wall biosynthesis
MQRTTEFSYEIWQPDTNADRIYEHTFENGVKHIHFPAKHIKIFHGIKRINGLQSDLLIEELANVIGQGVIIHLNSIADTISLEIIRKFSNAPKVINFHSRISSIPIHQIFVVRKNIFLNFEYFIRHMFLKKNKNVVYTYNNSTNIEYLNNYKNLGVYRSFTAIDFNNYQIADKDKAKAKFNLSSSTKVFSMASRFVTLKQIDKVIDIFSKIDSESNYDFKLLIAGHGELEYENYLKSVGKKLIDKRKLEFVGYLVKDKLADLYQATDLFISASTTEGGPTSVIKAIAYSIPVFITRVGGVDDFFIKSNTPKVMDVRDYTGWYSYFSDVLANRIELKAFNRVDARNMFDWNITARDYIEIYKGLYQCHEK